MRPCVKYGRRGRLFVELYDIDGGELLEHLFGDGRLDAAAVEFGHARAERLLEILTMGRFLPIFFLPG